MDIEKKIRDLRAEIERHNRLYYIEAQPEIGDREYDALLHDLEELEKKHPELVAPDSPTQRVGGAPLDRFESVAHALPMISLANTYSKAELRDYDLRTHKLAPKAEFDYVLEPKIDGVAISLRYEKGSLVRALTRGDGRRGDDVTANVRTIRSIPLHLTIPPTGRDALEVPPLLEVRGEIYMTRKGFAQLNRQREEDGEASFANPRNATAGSLKQLDPSVVAERPLDAIFYALGDTKLGLNQKPDTQRELLEMLSDFGLRVPSKYWVCPEIDTLIDKLDELERMRHRFPFQVDGGVIKVNQRLLYTQLGSTAKSPRWAVAYKYEPDRAETKLKGITIQVGRTGVLTPVAELEPVFLDGSTVARATLHNAEEIERKGVRIGDRVLVEKAGDIIPAIAKVLSEKRDGSEVEFAMPEKCPVCGELATHRDGEVALRCENLQCPAQLTRLVQHFTSRNALDIKSLGGKVAAKLVQRGLIKHVLDLFDLTKNQFSSLNLGTQKEVRVFGPSNADKALNSLNAARKAPLNKWLFALGIPRLGGESARIIASAHTDLKEVLDSELLRKVVTLDALQRECRRTNPRARRNADKSKLEKAELGQKRAELFAELDAEATALVDVGWYKKSVLKTGLTKYVMTDDGIGVDTAERVIGFFESDRGADILDRLENLGINPRSQVLDASSIISGKTFVLTGSLETMSRQNATDKIHSRAGKISSSVSGNTDYLVAGKNPGAKLDEARERQVQILNEDQFRTLLGEDDRNQSSNTQGTLGI